VGWLLVAGPAPAMDLADGTADPSPPVERSLGTDRARASRLAPIGTAEGREKERALSVYLVYAMHFGTLCDNDGYVVLGTADAITEDPAHLVYGGSPQSAEISIDGEANWTVGVSVTAGSPPGFTLGDFESDHGALPLSGLTLDETGLRTIRLGARLQVSASSVAEGSGQQIGYTVSIVYD